MPADPPSAIARNGPLGAAAVAGVAALVAVVAQSPLLRGAMLIVAVLGAYAVPALAGLTRQRRAGAPAWDFGHELPPEPPWVRALQALATLLYMVGLMVAVLGVTVRLGWVDVGVPFVLLQWAPLPIALYLPLLAFAVRRQLDREGALRSTWYTRTHAWGIIAWSLVALPAMVLLSTSGPVTLFGVPWGQPELFFFALVSLLMVGTQTFLSTGMATLFDIIQGALTRDGRAARSSSQTTPPLVYAGVLAIAVVGLLAFIISEVGLFGRLGGFRNERAIYFVILLPAGLASFFLASAMMVWWRGRRGLYRKKIPTKLRNDLLVYGGSALGGLAGAYLLFLVLTGRVEAIGPLEGPGLIMDVIAFTVVVSLAPLGSYLHRQNRRVDGIEERLPDFLNDLAETRRAGLTLAAALKSVSQSDYGDLSPEIRRMSDQVSWGVPFTEAMRQMAERVDTALVKRAAYLVIEASKSGGSVAEVLKATASDAYELKALESDRRATMMTYLVVIYVVFAVFLVVIAVLQNRFIPEVLGAAIASEEAGSGLQFLQSGGVDPESIAFIYYNAAIVQSIGNGLVGGVLSEGRITAGFRHVAIMTGLAWFTFRLLLA